MTTDHHRTASADGPHAQDGARSPASSTSPRSSSRSRQLGLYDGVLNNPNFVLGAGSDTRRPLGRPLRGPHRPHRHRHRRRPLPGRQALRRQSRAMGFVASRTLEAAMIFVGVLSVLARLHPPPGLRRRTDAEPARSPPPPSASSPSRTGPSCSAPGSCPPSTPCASATVHVPVPARPPHHPAVCGEVVVHRPHRARSLADGGRDPLQRSFATSPTANTPGREVSNGSGSRPADRRVPAVVVRRGTDR